MNKVTIIGSKGVIGSVLHERLSHDHEVVGLDLPDNDATDYELLLNRVRGSDIVIHVAHSANPETQENWRSGRIDPVNVLMTMNVFKAATEAGVRRLIMASSVHADDFNNYQGSELLTVPGSYAPTSPYGVHKLVIEEIGKFYSTHHDIEFIGIRFGGVTTDNSVRTHLKEPAVWLSHRDLITAVEACVTALKVPDNYAVFYAVSNNSGRVHDTKNPFGWQPIDNSQDYV